MMRPIFLVIFLAVFTHALIVLASTASAADSGTIIRNADLKSKPAFSGKTLAKLAPQTTLQILQRKGGWFEVQVPNPAAQGWVRMLSVRLGTVGPAKGDSGLKSLLNFARSGNTGTTTVATGVRGLSEEQLEKAKPNPKELARMQTFAANKKTAKTFARQAKLKAASVAHLPDMRKKAQSSSNTGKN